MSSICAVFSEQYLFSITLSTSQSHTDVTPQWLDNEFRRYAHISVKQTVLPRLLTLAGRCQGLSEAKKGLIGTEMY